MPVIILCGLIGLSIAGFRGLLLGAALGYVLNWALRSFAHTKLGSVQAQFLESTFAVMGAMCKADGVVTRDEIAIAESMFTRLHLSSEQRETAKVAFNRGKSADFDLDAEIVKFARVTRGYRPLLVMFLQIQCVAVAADGNVHPAEHRMLIRIAHLLGLTEADVEQLEALLRASTGGPSPQASLDDAYAALGLTSSATDAQIKQAYRRLMSQNHPDKLAGKGLPESMREMAEERTREIGLAYAALKTARGFN